MIFIELLSAGTLAALSLLLALFSLGLSPAVVAEIPVPDVVAAVLAIAFVYPLGIVIDGIADKALSKVGANYKIEFNLPEEHSVFSLLTTRPNDFSEKYFEYNRVRTRMVRSFLLNSALMLVCGSWCGTTLGWSGYWLSVWIAFWALSCLLAYWSLRELRKSWFRMLAIAWGDWPSPDTSQ